ncbi:MAG: hypothetical protein KKA28_06680 [Planctomycetes bacterium]|nr:hypothetical protein [Planctomycetota bacterium]MCG2682589.1 hypothetical protein [Planctomycetales bacterium]
MKTRKRRKSPPESWPPDEQIERGRIGQRGYSPRPATKARPDALPGCWTCQAW